MRLGQEITLGIGALLVLQLLTAFAAIGLFARMTPAVERIIQENVFSLEATEHMLAVLAAPQVTPDGQAAFRDALARARGNVTDPREAPLIDIVDAHAPRALAGESDARARVVAALGELGAVNREHMRAADLTAQRLGRAGAWSAVVLGIATFLVGQLVYRRVRLRVEGPVRELDAALEAARKGDPHRRCVTLEGPRELDRMAQNLNWLLDRVSPRDPREGEDRLRAVVLQLLDSEHDPLLVLDRHEGIVAMNRSALRLLDGEEGAGDVLEAVRAGRKPAGWRIDPVGETGLHLARVGGSRPEDSS